MTDVLLKLNALLLRTPHVLTSLPVIENSPGSSPFCKQPVTIFMWLMGFLSCFSWVAVASPNLYSWRAQPYNQSIRVEHAEPRLLPERSRIHFPVVAPEARLGRSMSTKYLLGHAHSE
jgi:hypothetical protein